MVTGMYLKYEEYQELGYTKVPDEVFEQYEADAEALVRGFTFNRITDDDMRPSEDADAEAQRIAVMNRRGMCRLIDLYYSQSHEVIGEKGGVIKSFTNEGYTETLDTAAKDEKLVQEKAKRIIFTYFTPEQLYRGVP